MCYTWRTLRILRILRITLYDLLTILRYVAPLDPFWTVSILTN